MKKLHKNSIDNIIAKHKMVFMFVEVIFKHFGKE